ncbi:MAG: hypothetical protein RIS09_820 [Actinomycetota bacterium]|jgi:hypothetical protein
MKFEYHASQFVTEHSEEEKQQFTVEFGAITSKMSSAMLEGHPANSKVVQDLVAAHYTFVSKFWTPTKSAYKNLALMYIVPSEYREYYENFTEGLSKFTYDAICIWADTHLSD